MNRIIKVMIPLFVVLLSGCEQILDLNAYTDPKITLTAVATPDTVLMASVSRVFISFDRPPIMFDDYWYYTHYILGDSTYHNDAVIPNATVKAVVNGSETYTMRYDSKNYNYTCDYTPHIGDHIELTAKAEGFPETTAETQLLPKQKIELVSKQKYYKSCGVDFSQSALTDLTVDTAMLVTLKITDPLGEKNYYRLKVRSLANTTWDDGRKGYDVSDIFSSSDIIFKDENLTSSFGSWPAYFTNVFDDHLFDGKEYTFSVESQMRGGTNPHLLIELQSITPELYYYTKSQMLYRIQNLENDAYSEPIQIFSNVIDGFGIVGGLTPSSIIVPF